MANNLNASSSGSSSQTTTQDPQASVQPLDTGTQSSGVQPGTAENLLNSQAGGVRLNVGSLSTVSLAPGTTSASTQASTTPKSTPKHHANTVLIGAAVLLFLAAIVLFWATSRSVKNTT